MKIAKMKNCGCEIMFDDLLKINELEKLVNSTNDKLQTEISGKSGTGYGRGYVAQSIERQLNTIQSDLKIARVERNSFLEKFDQAVDRGTEEELKKYLIHPET